MTTSADVPSLDSLTEPVDLTKATASPKPSMTPIYDQLVEEFAERAKGP